MSVSAPAIRRIWAVLCFEHVLHISLAVISIPLCLVVPFLIASFAKPAPPNQPNTWQAAVFGFSAFLLFTATRLFKNQVLDRAYMWSIREMLADARRRGKAEELIREAPPAAAVPLLLNGIKIHTNEHVRATCIRLLLRYELHQEALNSVKAALTDPSVSVRDAAARFLDARAPLR